MNVAEILYRGFHKTTKNKNKNMKEQTDNKVKNYSILKA